MDVPLERDTFFFRLDVSKGYGFHGFRYRKELGKMPFSYLKGRTVDLKD